MTPAVAAVRRAAIDFELIEYHHDPGAPSYGEEAARVLGQDPTQVFKTLLVSLDGGRLAVGVVPVAKRLDLKAVASALRAKRAAMAEPAAAERATGYVVGGISPLGQRKRLPTVIDESATGFTRIFVSGGKRGLEIALAPRDLAGVLGASFAPIAR